MPLPKFLTLPPAGNRTFGLDLLRAVAIIMVLLWHGTAYVSPRFTLFYKYVLRFDGVNLFFVLSGFLIGGILIKTLENKPPTFTTLWEFWLKRWIRTIPPYFLALSISMALASWYVAPDWPAYIKCFLFIQNLNWPHPNVFGVGWSLSVEEWFYLLSAPSVFILAALKLKPRAAVLVAAVTVLLLTTLNRYHQFQVIKPHDVAEWDSLFRKIVFMRLDNLMFGVLAAYWAFYFNKSWLKYKLPKFIIGLVWLYFQFEPRNPGDFGIYGCVYYFSVQAIAIALMLPLLSDWKSSPGRIGGVITHISLISYSLYLLHSAILNNFIILPLIKSLPVPQSIAAAIGLFLYWSTSLFFGTLMYKYFEVPIMGLRSRLRIGEPVKIPSTSFLSSSPGPLYGRGFLLPSRIKKAFYAALGRLGFWLPARLPRSFGGYTPQNRVTLAKYISMFDPQIANYHSISGLHEPLDVYPFHFS